MRDRWRCASRTWAPRWRCGASASGALLYYVILCVYIYIYIYIYYTYAHIYMSIYIYTCIIFVMNGCIALHHIITCYYISILCRMAKSAALILPS